MRKMSGDVRSARPLLLRLCAWMVALFVFMEIPLQVVANSLIPDFLWYPITRLDPSSTRPFSSRYPIALPRNLPPPGVHLRQRYRFR